MADETPDFVSRHLQFGWWSLLVFLSLGIVLEVLHGFKIGFYLDVSNETRRLLWTLAHAHGALLGLVHLGLAFTAQQRPGPWVAKASPLLMGASVLLPGGFFLGGFGIEGGDPGLEILLLPVEALLLLGAVVLVASGSRKTSADG